MPQFLLEVYKRSLAEDGAINSSGGRHTRSTSEDGDQLITALDKEVIDQSDIIMTFLNKSKLPISLSRYIESSTSSSNSSPPSSLPLLLVRNRISFSLVAFIDEL